MFTATARVSRGRSPSLWGQTEYAPKDLRLDVKTAAANTVLLNGSCHSGLFRNVNRCGFLSGQARTALHGLLLSEAHARASNLADGDVPYTRIDALADRMLSEEKTKSLFTKIALSPAKDLIDSLTPVERVMYRRTWHAPDVPTDAQLMTINLGAAEIEDLVTLK